MRLPRNWRWVSCFLAIGYHNFTIKLEIQIWWSHSKYSWLDSAATAFQWYEKFTDVDEVIPVSAKYGHGVEDVKEWILSKLPFGPPYYPKVLLKRTLSFAVYQSS